MQAELLLWSCSYIGIKHEHCYEIRTELDDAALHDTVLLQTWEMGLGLAAFLRQLAKRSSRQRARCMK